MSFIKKFCKTINSFFENSNEVCFNTFKKGCV